MGNNNTDTPSPLSSSLDHVADKGIVTFALRRNAAMPAIEALHLLTCLVGAPLIEGEGRIGRYYLETHELVVFYEFGFQERIAPFDTRAVLVVEEHVHHAERPGAADRLLTEERNVIAFVSLADVAGTLKK